MIKNSRTVLIDKNREGMLKHLALPELGTEIELIHEPSVGVIGNKETLSVTSVSTIRFRLYNLV